MCRDGVAPDLGHKEQPGRSRLPEDVLCLGRLKARVDGHQSQPSQRSAVLFQHPLRHVVRPHRDMFARLEALQETAGAALGVGNQLGISPLSSLRPRQPLDEGDAIRHLGGDFSQPAADRRAHQQRWPATVGNPV
jgi:hypothetical protein